MLTNRMTDYLQFPERLKIITTCMLSLAGGFAFIHIAKERRREMLLFVLAIALFSVMPMLRAERETEGFASGEIVSPYTVHLEYQIPGTDVGDTRDKSVLIEGDVQMMRYSKDGTRITAEIAAQSDAVLTLPLIGFDGYKAKLNEEELQWIRGENNRLSVLLPAGAHGELCVWFEGKMAWKLADAVSLISMIGFVVYALRKSRKMHIEAVH